MRIFVLVLLLAACGREVDDDPLAPCHVPGLARLAECGTVEATGEPIALSVVRLPANGKEAAAEPLFLLAGGPGQGAVEGFGPLLPLLAPVTREHSVVLVDMRGTGSSAPLDCEAPDSLGAQLRAGGLVRVARTCRERHRARDLSAYTTARAVDDLDAVRLALGYDRIDLLGVSYGTRLALAYAARHPDHTNALVLDGVAPPALRLPLSFAKDAQAALDRVLRRCARDAACHAAFPDPSGALHQVLMELENEPRTLTLRHPFRGVDVAIALDAAVFAQVVRELLYATELHALLPYTLSRAKEGDFAPLVAQAALFGADASEMMSLGLMLSVVCAEDVPRIATAEIDQATEGTFLGRSLIDEMMAACAIWDVPVAEIAQLPTDVPTLALSGGADPVTPPRWAEVAIASLPRRKHVVMDHAGHGIFARGCVPRLIARFLSAPTEVASLDASCVTSATPAPFFVSPAGPPP